MNSLFKGGIVGLKKGFLEWQLIHLLIEGAVGGLKARERKAGCLESCSHA